MPRPHDRRPGSPASPLLPRRSGLPIACSPAPVLRQVTAMTGTIFCRPFPASHNAFRHLSCICVLISDSVKRFAGLAPECSKIKRKNWYYWYRGTCRLSPNCGVLSPIRARSPCNPSPNRAPCLAAFAPGYGPDSPPTWPGRFAAFPGKSSVFTLFHEQVKTPFVKKANPA